MSEKQYVSRQYFKFRVLEKPYGAQAFQFLLSEVGELTDALVSSAGN